MALSPKSRKPEHTTFASDMRDEFSEVQVCDTKDQRQCADGTCVKRMELCPEEERMSQDTILIMIGVGMGVVLFLIVLYCLQQRRNEADNMQPAVDVEDIENPELLIPPPSYEEALNVSLYPPTPQMQRTGRVPSSEEPITPPPNYDTALHILAQSHESVLTEKNRVASPLLRKALSLEHVGNNSQRRPSTSTTEAERPLLVSDTGACQT